VLNNIENKRSVGKKKDMVGERVGEIDDN